MSGGLVHFISCGCLPNTKNRKTRRKAPVIFIFGVPTSGKATVGQKLADMLGYTHFNMGQMLDYQVSLGSFKGKTIEELRKAKSTMPSDILVGLLNDEWPPAPKGIVISGFPSNMKDVRHFEGVMKIKPAVVIFCTIPEDVYLTRYPKKHGAQDQSQMRQNYQRDKKGCEAVYKYYGRKAIQFDTNAPLAENSDRLMAGMKKMGIHSEVAKKKES